MVARAKRVKVVGYNKGTRIESVRPSPGPEVFDILDDMVDSMLAAGYTSVRGYTQDLFDDPNVWSATQMGTYDNTYSK